MVPAGWDVFGIMGETDKAYSSGVASFEQADHPLDLVESWQHLATFKRQSKDIQGTSETQHWSTVLVASEKRPSMCLLNAQNIIKHQCQRAEKCLIKIRFFLEREPGSETRPSKSKNARKSRKQAKTKKMPSYTTNSGEVVSSFLSRMSASKGCASAFVSSLRKHTELQENPTHGTWITRSRKAPLARKCESWG